MAESLSFQEITARLMAYENVINNQHRESFKYYKGWCWFTFYAEINAFNLGQV